MPSNTGLMLSLLRAISYSPIKLSSTSMSEKEGLSPTLKILLEEKLINREVDQKTEDYFVIILSITPDGLKFKEQLEVMDEL